MTKLLKNKQPDEIPLRKIKKNPITPYILLLPAVFLFCMFVIYPFIKTLYLSFTLTNARGEVTRFFGLNNYLRLFKSESFWRSILVSFKFAVLVGVPSFLIGFVLALMASNQLRGSRIYEVMYSMPLAVASAPAAAIWFMILNPATGILNHILRTHNNWLSDPKIALISVAMVTVWCITGTTFIFLLTGFRNVPAELLESASLDGANYFRRVIHVIVPVASPQIFFVIFFDTIQSFQTFAQIKLLTDGGPSYQTETLVFSLYRTAFLDARWETACTMSVILFLIIFLITRIEFLFEGKVNY